ncbi:MAG TPA: MMPL family transporter [Candidatus Nanoarchaeia archaeon]|nr:MMPL family transporter [Candidatus Nanoarchaeia archaeon]
MGKIRKMFTNVRVLVLVIFLILGLFAVYPNPWNEGLAIRHVEKNSSASLAGVENPAPTSTPMSRERILAVNNNAVTDIKSLYSLLSLVPSNATITLKTNKNLYRLTARPASDGKMEDFGLSVYPAPKTNIRKGLDLQGGTRVILQPAEEVSKEDLGVVMDNIKERLNVYGLGDIVVRSTTDLAGKSYILVEIAGANQEEVRDLLAKQGKFEAKVGNTTVFKGGGDVTYVCRSADCSGLDPNAGCQQQEGGWYCGFRFSISLDPKAAQRQADATRLLAVVSSPSGNYLSEKLSLYLDDEQVDELNIGAELKGSAVTEIQISGSGNGVSNQEAIQNTLESMKRLQTILITGSLPVKLNIVKMDSISPVLGEEFLKNAIFVCLLSVITVSVLLFIRYRRLSVSIPIIITMLSEVFLTLALAAIIGWNIDLASIAGIIVAIGTGVDDQIVIADETLYRKKLEGGEESSWKDKLKSAFFIIFAAYFTLTAAMIPLLFAGAGLLKGFAITTILAVTIGVLVTRPAYAAFIEILTKE